MKNLNGSVPVKSPDRRTVLDRILDIPSLEQVVPRLQPDLLHRVIQSLRTGGLRRTRGTRDTRTVDAHL